MSITNDCVQFLHDGCVDCAGINKCTNCAYRDGTCDMCALRGSLSCDKFREQWEAEQAKQPFVCLEPSCYACCNLVNGRCAIDGKIHNNS